MDKLRELTFLGVALRMFFALLCGAVIGFERERDGKEAGLRTHIMVCLGSAMVTATSEYFVLILGLYTDVARLGAQVISGLGFIGAGGIVVTRYRRVKGLTTAAGLWVVGIIGLCCGAGFYEGALLCTVLLYIGMYSIAKLERKYFNQARTVTMFLSYEKKKDLRDIIQYLKDVDVKVTGFYAEREPDNGENPYIFLNLGLHRKISPEDIITDLTALSLVRDIKVVNE